MLGDALQNLVFTSGCTCPGYTLIYECTVMSGPGGVTVWNGTALNCTSNEIVLLHRRFTSADGAFDVCNNGSIVGQSLRVEDNFYTSQLNVTFNSDMIGESISCVHDSTTIHVIGVSTIVATGMSTYIVLSAIIPQLAQCSSISTT